MEKPVRGFAVLLLVLAANVSMSQAQTQSVYFTDGGELILSPVPVSGPITSIVWKYDKNLLAEWAKDSIPLTYYPKFKGRSELNTTTGVLVLQRMTAADNGVYSVEINNKVQSQVYQTVQIGKVPRPTVLLQPLVCNRTQPCALKCDADVSAAQPVSYFWKKDGGEWESGGEKKELSTVEKDRVKTFSCRMKNPVSEETSDTFNNPLYQEEKTPEGPSVGKIVGGFIGVLVAIVLIGLGIRNKDQLMKRFCNSGPESPPKDKDDNHEPLKGSPGSPPPDESNELNEVKPSGNDDKAE